MIEKIEKSLGAGKAVLPVRVAERMKGAEMQVKIEFK